MSGHIHSPGVSGSDGPKPTVSRVVPSAERFRRGLGHRWTRVRERLLWGVPWGTLVTCCVLVFVYLAVQNGAERWSGPLVIPFTSWSYSHPLGVFLGPVSHIGPEHLVDNLLGVLVFGSVAEYVFGHTLADGTATDRLWTRPGVRAFGLFPGAALVAGILASAFSWGPTIGFSNVVYAFAGFALLRYPLGTVIAVSVQEGLGVVVRSIDQPRLVATGTQAADPWFVDVAVQGHLFGVGLGLTAGFVTVSLRDADLPSPGRLWAGTALFALAQSLWVVWWPRGTEYVLARGLGVVVVGCLATVVAAVACLAPGDGEQSNDVAGVHAGVVLLLVPLALMAGIAVPINTAGDVTTPPGAETVDVRGYGVTYVEDATNQRLAPFAVATGTDQPRASGVLVVEPDRGVFTQAVDASRLASDGTATIRLGGLGWERRVFAVRRGWRAAGGNVTFQVWIHPNDGRFHRVYDSGPASATPVVAGYNLSIVPERGRFRIRVDRDNATVGTAAIPNRGETVTVGALDVRRDGDRLVATVGRTRVPIAWRR